MVLKTCIGTSLVDVICAEQPILLGEQNSVLGYDKPLSMRHQLTTGSIYERRTSASSPHRYVDLFYHMGSVIVLLNDLPP